MIEVRIGRWPLVLVRLEPYTIEGGDLSRAQITDALVDTGAEMTNVTPGLFTRLQLAASTFIRQSGVDGEIASGQPRPAGRARLSLVRDDGTVEYWTEITVVAGFGGEEGGRIGCLLGMDVLRHAHLTLDGPNRTGGLTFPPVEPDAR